MFQMTVVAPQTHLKPTSEVVNHPDTLFLMARIFWVMATFSSDLMMTMK